MKYKIVEKLTKKQINDLYKLYKKEWWTNTRDKKSIKKMLKHTDITLAIVNKKEKLIGFIRVLSDFTYKAEIYDVIVATKYRNKGLGSILIKSILNHKKLKNVEQFNLQCKKDMVPYYKKFGFKKIKNLNYLQYSKSN